MIATIHHLRPAADTAGPSVPIRSTVTGAELLAKKPEGANRLIIAIEVEDTSDPMSDYFADRDVRRVAIGWTTSTKESFPALRKAAALFPPTEDLATAAKDAEHRENYSMGAGNYLKDGGRHNDGWKVKSLSVKYLAGGYATDEFEDAIEFCNFGGGSRPGNKPPRRPS